MDKICAILTIVSDLPLNEGQIGSISMEFINKVCEVWIEKKSLQKKKECPEMAYAVFSKTSSE